MSELASPINSGGQPGNWLSLDEAARRSGRSVGHLRRTCGELWFAAGLATMMTPPVGGKKAWFVREDADPSLARGKFPEQIGTDLRKFPEAKRQEVIHRLEILNRWRTSLKGGYELNFPEEKITAQFLHTLLIEDDLRISRRTLYNWENRYRQSGLAGLVDGRGAREERIDDPFLEQIKHFYLNLRKRKLTVCYEMAEELAQEKGWNVCSYTTVQRFIGRIDKATILRYRFGETAFENEAEPYIERDYSTLVSNEQWCGDHHQFDVMVKHDGRIVRPWLTAWMDMRSRKIVGWSIVGHDPNQDTILAALRSGVQSHGVPQSVYVDNGKDFDSFALHGRTKWQKRKGKIRLDTAFVGGVFGALAIDARMCWKYHGQSKPIERFFGTLGSRFSPLFDTYCGNSTGNKPEDLADQLERGRAMELSEFAQVFQDWLEHDYHARVHTGDSMAGQCPDDVFTQCLAVKRTAPEGLLDVLLLKPTKALSVSQNGITFNGLRYGANDPHLFPLLGRKVILRVDDRDLSQVQVYQPDGKFVCIAQANQRLPANASSQDLRLAIGEKRKASRLMREMPAARLRMTEDIPDLMIRAAARRNAKPAVAQGGDDTPPPSIQPVRSALEDQLPAIQRALETTRAKAVGAESILPRAFNYQSNNSGAGEGESALGSPADYLKYREEANDE